MEARIAKVGREFAPQTYGQADLEAFLNHHGIRFGCTPQLRLALLKALQSGVELAGKLVAQGRSGQPAAYGEVEPVALPHAEGATLLERQPRLYAVPGDVLAKVEYAQAEEPGTDVFGNRVAPPPPDAPKMSAGAGVRFDGSRYLATDTGTPVYKNSLIKIQPGLVISGDVTVARGHIDFDGPVFVDGHVEAGVRMRVGGDLMVAGRVEGGTLRCGGSLRVQGGIVTGPDNRIDVGGDLEADFIENARVLCRGTVTAHRGILGALVVAGHEVHVIDSEAVVAGSTVIAQSHINVYHLGREQGRLTVVRAGSDWRAERSALHHGGRYQRLKAAREEVRKGLRVLAQKSPAQRTAKHKAQMEALSGRLQRLIQLIDRSQRAWQAAQEAIISDTAAQIRVHGTLATNCELHIAGRAIPVPHAVAEVVAVYKAQRGANIVPLESAAEAS